MRMFLYGFVTIAMLLGGVGADADIYRCEDPEAGIIYQETPCPAPKVEEAEEPDDAAETNGPATPAAESQPRRLARGQSLEDTVASIEEENQRRAEVEACKQQYRDAIDAIDLEIQNSYSPEQKEYYLGRLKALTEQMSAC